MTRPAAAARRLRRSDVIVDREHAHLVTGHRTQAMFDRYNIDDDLQLKDANGPREYVRHRAACDRFPHSPAQSGDAGAEE